MKPTKKLLAILILCIVTFGSFDSIAQKGTSTIVNSQELFDLYDEDTNTNTRIRFCHDFTVTIDLQFMEIETTITVCCAQEIYGCIPVPGTQSRNEQIEFPNDLEISNSSTVTQGRYRVTIVDGNYRLNKKGEIINLLYNVTEI